MHSKDEMLHAGGGQSQDLHVPSQQLQEQWLRVGVEDLHYNHFLNARLFRHEWVKACARMRVKGSFAFWDTYNQAAASTDQ